MDGAGHLWMEPWNPAHGEIDLFPLQFSVLLQVVLPVYPCLHQTWDKIKGEHQPLCP